MTSTIGISDVIGRVQQIQQQLQQLQSGQLLDSMLGISGSSGAATGAPQSGAATSFSSALAAAQTPSGMSAPAGMSAGALNPNVAAISQTGSPPVGSASLGIGAPGGTAALGAGSFGVGSVGSGSLATVTGGVGIGGAALPPAAGTMLTSAQRQFASTLAAETGLNPGVVSAWLLAEENGGAAQARQAAGNNDWLNIGYTDSGTYGAADSVWSNPVTAASATAQWLRGQASIPGYGAASSGIQAILQTVGQSPQAQIAALQGSGWASSGYPDLGQLYTQVSGVAA